MVDPFNLQTSCLQDLRCTWYIFPLFFIWAERKSRVCTVPLQNNEASKSAETGASLCVCVCLCRKRGLLFLIAVESQSCSQTCQSASCRRVRQKEESKNKFDQLEVVKTFAWQHSKQQALLKIGRLNLWWFHSPHYRLLCVADLGGGGEGTKTKNGGKKQNKGNGICSELEVYPTLISVSNT